MPKKALFIAALINSALLLLPLAMVEGIFRLLPVSYPPYLLPVNAENPVTRFQPNLDYFYSENWNFEVQTHRHTNNYGFSHVADYHPEQSTPLLMVIGGSLVEAHAVDGGKSVGELLHAAVQGEGRVYSMGVSGAPLSEDLVYADYARKTFHPDAMAFVIVGHDYHESLFKYNSEPRFHYFEEKGDGFVLRRVDYEMSRTKKVLRHSAFLRYLMFDLHFADLIDDTIQLWRGQDHSVSAYTSPALEQRVLDADRAVDYFLDQLPSKSGLAPRSIVFVLDAVHDAMYSEEKMAQIYNHYVPRMRRYFAQQASARGYQVIDMEPVFIERHRADGSGFEVVPGNAQWGARAHEIAAEEIQNSEVFKRFFPVHETYESASLRTTSPPGHKRAIRAGSRTPSESGHSNVLDQGAIRSPGLRDSLLLPPLFNTLVCSTGNC